MTPALPPPGAAVRHEFVLADDFLAVNRGSCGATPTMGCNAVPRSLPLVPDDEIPCLGHVYDAVCNTLRHVAAGRGARLVVAELLIARPDRAAVLACLDKALGSAPPA